MTDQPTTPLPLPGRTDLSPAWDDSATRRSVNQSLWVGLLLMLVTLAAAAACVAIVWRGHLGEPWGLWVLVAVGGFAGGTCAGGLTVLILWSRTRRFLRAGPWEPGELTLGEDRDAELAIGRSLAQLRMDNRTGALGEVGDRIPVDVRAIGDRLLITVPPSRRVLRATIDPNDRG